LSYSTHMTGHKDPRTLYQIDRLHACAHDLYFPPAVVEISPVNVCNQKCRYCYSNGRVEAARRMNGDLLIDAMQQIKMAGVDAVCFQGTGEPLLHRNTPDAIAAAARHGLAVGLTTNGVLMNRRLQELILPHLHYLKLSALEMNPARYAFQHGCNKKQHDMLIRNIADLVAFRRDRQLAFGLTSSFYITGENYAEAYQVVDFLKKLGIDYVYVSEASFVSTSPQAGSFTSLNLGSDEIRKICDRLYSLADKDFSVGVALVSQDSMPFGPNHATWKPGYCQGIKFVTIVSSDGEVYPCYRLWGKKEFSYGSLYEQTFGEIWKSEKRRSIQDYISRTPPRSDECIVCGCIRHNIIHDRLNQATPWRHFL
jgi:GTP 3',8-cyclase